MKNISFLFLFILLGNFASGQDKIHTKLQQLPIEGDVVEISVNEIKYKPTGQSSPIISVDKQDVIKIVYKTGQVQMINNPLQDLQMYRDQHRWNLKMNLLSPLFGHTQFFLEHAQKPGRSVEYELKLIGLGKDQKLISDYSGGESFYSARGAGIGIGMKVLRLPDYVNGQLRLRHIMQGAYIKPAISLDLYSRNFAYNGQNSFTHLKRKMVFSLHPHLTLGKQWILDNTVSVDLYALIGYSFDNVRTQQRAVLNDNGQYSIIDDFNTPFNGFGYTRFQRGDFGLTLGTGIRVGFLFDFKNDKQ